MPSKGAMTGAPRCACMTRCAQPDKDNVAQGNFVIYLSGLCLASTKSYIAFGTQAAPANHGRDSSISSNVLRPTVSSEK